MITEGVIKIKSGIFSYSKTALTHNNMDEQRHPYLKLNIATSHHICRISRRGTLSHPKIITAYSFCIQTTLCLLFFLREKCMRHTLWYLYWNWLHWNLPESTAFPRHPLSCFPSLSHQAPDLYWVTLSLRVNKHKTTFNKLPITFKHTILPSIALNIVSGLSPFGSLLESIILVTRRF